MSLEGMPPFQPVLRVSVTKNWHLGSRVTPKYTSSWLCNMVQDGITLIIAYNVSPVANTVPSRLTDVSQTPMVLTVRPWRYEFPGRCKIMLTFTYRPVTY